MVPTDVNAPAAPPSRLGVWLVLGVSVASTLLVVLDNSVLVVAVPTIRDDLDTTTSSLQWVFSGYALTFGSLLVLGGRLGDLHGHRRMLIIGATLFGTGSLVAATARSVGTLMIGEAFIEGVGAALMTPATLALLATHFEGRMRAVAFAAWGTTTGVGAAFGPLLGGTLTTHASWRWGFGINVCLAALTAVGARLVLHETPRSAHRPRLDITGALLVTAGVLLVVLAIGQGPTYGWWRPVREVEVLGLHLADAGAAVPFTPLMLLIGGGLLVAFARVERRRSDRGAVPLLDPALLADPALRRALATTGLYSMSVLGVLFVLPVFLQDVKGLSAQQNGLWMMPMGVAVIVGAQTGGRLAGRFGGPRVVSWGLAAITFGILGIALVAGPDATLGTLSTGLVVYGLGIGAASAQLNLVVMSMAPTRFLGVTGGTTNTLRQLGSAIGLTAVGTLLAVATSRAILDAAVTVDLPAAEQAELRGLPPGDLIERVRGADAVPGLDQALVDGTTTGTRHALLLAAAIAAAGWATIALGGRRATRDPGLGAQPAATRRRSRAIARSASPMG